VLFNVLVLILVLEFCYISWQLAVDAATHLGAEKKKQVQGIRNDWHEGQVSRRAPVFPAATGSRPGQLQEAKESLCHRYYKPHVCGMSIL
jgi:hypothetical protein